MGALVETALVADDFAGVEGGAAPGGWFGGVTVEAAAAQILGLLGSGVVSVLDWEAGVGREVRHGNGMAGGGGGCAEKGRL
jgi:hypothetical protein